MSEQRPMIFRGVDPNSRMRGRDAWGNLRGVNPGMTDAHRDQAMGFLGYDDPTGEKEIGGSDWNRLAEEAAKMFGGQYQAWQPAGPTRTINPPDDDTDNLFFEVPRSPQQPPSNQPSSSSYRDYNQRLRLPDPLRAPNPFTVKPFNAPTYETAMNDPGYQFALQQGFKGINAQNAAEGDIFTGGSMKELINYGQAAATQQYDKVFGREYDRWKTEYGMDADASDRNFGQTTGVYDRNVDRSVLEDKAWRDDRNFKFGIDVWEDERAFRDKSYESGERRWGREFEQRRREFASSDEFRRRVYGTDDEYRRWRDTVNDAWKREVMDEERRRWLAELGTR